MSTSRIRVLFVSLLAVFAVGAVASASASAAQHFYTCKKVASGKYATKAGCLKNELTAGEFERVKLAEGVSVKTTSKGTETFVLKSTLAGVKIKISCTTEADTGTIENPNGKGAGVDTATITFTGCTLTEGPAKCKVSEPIEAKTKTVLVEKYKNNKSEEFTAIADEFAPTETGGDFTELKLTGCEKSEFNTTYPVKGTDFGIVKNATSSLEFTEKSSNLTFGGNPATLTGASEQETTTGKEGIVVAE